MLEECFDAAKVEVGLDQYEVRSWHYLHRHITPATAPDTFLATEYTPSADIDPVPKGDAGQGETMD